MGSIRLGGILIPVKDSAGRDVVVHRYDEPGSKVPEFKPGDGYNKVRRKNIDLLVWHWTGGENEPLTVAKTLRKRKLGVEFAISRTGEIYQFCDPCEVDTADAGVMNARSVGVEIVCYGFPRKGPAGDGGIIPRFGVIPKLGKDRQTHIEVIHGKRVRVAEFYDVQLRAAYALADALTQPLPPRTFAAAAADDLRALTTISRMRIPRTVAVGTEVMPQTDLAFFAGSVGHHQISKGKFDTGAEFLDGLAKHWSRA